MATKSRAGQRKSRSSERRASGKRTAPGWQRYTAPILMGASVGLVLLLAMIAFNASEQQLAKASDFEFEVYQGQETIGGPTVNFEEVLAIGKPTVLNFWAGNCLPCRAEMTDLQRNYEEFKDDITFLGLDIGVYTELGSRRNGLALLDELSVTYPAGEPPTRRPVNNYNVNAMPTTVFFDANGEVFSRWEGLIRGPQLNAILQEMVQ
ncbi:MAG: TlpA disulfide reductase family protein [SAR202 cluster bacterium]|nr:TlpA disulfide reductase family protein [SAR202 cluster bacterium]